MADREVIVEKSGAGSGMGVIAAVVGIIMLLVLAYLAFMYFGAPQTQDTNITVPTPEVNVQTPVTE